MNAVVKVAAIQAMAIRFQSNDSTVGAILGMFQGVFGSFEKKIDDFLVDH